ncbi:20 kDa protein [Rehmannia virus 1]|uniref:20 kDa protein n=1 Tax=Rehmannia virus 1 TaxID=2316740 RepID=A0A385HW67_9CLOS|nr:20 kDa protein [Rehmannia virus 1]AXY55039.1 20 kDa protein [Rehmannia virus 1]
MTSHNFGEVNIVVPSTRSGDAIVLKSTPLCDVVLLVDADRNEDCLVFLEDSLLMKRGKSSDELTCGRDLTMVKIEDCMAEYHSANLRNPRLLPVANRHSNCLSYVDFILSPVSSRAVFRMNLSNILVDDTEVYQDSLVKLDGYWDNGAQHQSMFQYLSNFINYEKYSIDSFECFLV